METYQPPLQQECDPGRGCMELHIAEYEFGPRNKLWHIQYQNIELQDVEANNMLVRQSSPERLHTHQALWLLTPPDSRPDKKLDKKLDHDHEILE